MKKFFLATLLLQVIAGLVVGFDFHETELETEERLWDLYERWRNHHTLSRSLDDQQRRYDVFKANAHYINDFNKMDKPYKLELNKFADMTNHEFRSIYTGSKVEHNGMFRDRPTNGSFMYENVQSVPTSIDWRKIGAVNPIKDQGVCGSSWAFSTVVAVEGINYIKTKKLVSLSEQQLVDCDNISLNQGCDGGDLVDMAFDYIEINGGLTTSNIYPYKDKNGECDTEKEKAMVVSIDGHQSVPINNEGALLKVVANQPVAVGIEVGGPDFVYYSKGVFTGKCGTELDHGMAIVGYGTQVDGTKYWIVRNSWGTDWGEKGYVRMKRGTLEKHGQCGIAMKASYPIKISSNNHKL